MLLYSLIHLAGIRQGSPSTEANKLPALFDLSKIDFVDSSGLGALVQLAKQCTDAKRAFQLVGNTRVAQTIKLVRLEEFLHLVNDVPTALSNLSA